MDKYLKKLMGDKTQAQISRELGVSSVVWSRWLNQIRPVPIYMALRIHKYTKGEIKYYELRPDLDRIDC